MDRAIEEAREAFRWLQLPVPIDKEDLALESAIDELAELGIAPEDIPTWLDLEISAWKETGTPSARLEGVVATYIVAADDGDGEILAEGYFRLHKRLAAEPLLGHEEATAVLSHARLMGLLAKNEKLSSARIASLIAARDQRAPAAWQQVGTILGQLDCRPALGRADIESVFEADHELELQVFADADLTVCVEMVADAAKKLGFPGDLRSPLKVLLLNRGQPNGPYLQMLHYQCVIAEYFDHVLSAIYEFSPRGEAARWLFERYPDSLEVKDNPFLNNAKSVDRLNSEWARSKKQGQVRESHALVAIIDGLDSMGFAARRELAAWLRRLLMRKIRLAIGEAVKLPDSLTASEAKSLLSRLAERESNTWGILEQRVVDALTAIKHPSPKWIARGLGDSVNATNMSRRKCGDCEYQLTDDRRVVAYEAHAGRLTDLYIKAHLRSLTSVLESRLKEWEDNVGPGLTWEVEVVFVAHDISQVAVPVSKAIGDVAVVVRAVEFQDLAGGVDVADAAVLESVQHHILEPLAMRRTPDAVRDTMLEMIVG